MSQQTSGYPPAAGNAADRPTTQVARDEASDVGRAAAQAGQHVAGTTGEQAGRVAHEARRQARDLIDQARTQAVDQARNGQQKAADGLRRLSGELDQMASNGDQRGPATDLAAQAATKIDDIADWLQRREPGDLLEEVRALGRRRPGMFLLGAVAAGAVLGRLTRGMVDAKRDTSTTGHNGAGRPGYTPMASPTGAAPAGYPTTPPPAPTPYAQPPGPGAPPPVQGGAPGTPPMPPPAGGSPYQPVPGPAGPNGPAPPGPGQAPGRGPTTVGEYVEEIERRGGSGTGSQGGTGGRP